MQAASLTQFRDLLSDTSFRDAIRNELKRPAAVRLFNGEWEKLQVLEVAQNKHRHYEGQSVASLAKAARVDPLDFMFDLALSEELETTFLSVLLNSDESAVARLLTHEYSTVALSDAGAHLTFFCDAGFGLHLMGHWVRDRQIMPLTEAIRRLTSHPAEIFGIRDRGRIEVGAFADLLLFDPATVGRSPSRRVWDLPAEQRRLTTDPLGVHGVWVNGTRIVNADGVVPIDNLPGRVLREF
jgi:N-acyl-D-aspartate/D-glutamate deacylase